MACRRGARLCAGRQCSRRPGSTCWHTRYTWSPWTSGWQEAPAWICSIKLPKAYPDTSALMISAVEETQTAIEALTYGACAYLVKPVKREELVFHARRALERRQLVLDNRRVHAPPRTAGAGADRRDSSRPGGDHLPLAFGIACGVTRRRACTSAGSACSAKLLARARGMVCAGGGEHPLGRPHARCRQDWHSGRHSPQAGKADCRRIPRSSNGTRSSGQRC